MKSAVGGTRSLSAYTVNKALQLIEISDGVRAVETYPPKTLLWSITCSCNATISPVLVFIAIAIAMVFVVFIIMSLWQAFYGLIVPLTWSEIM